MFQTSFAVILPFMTAVIVMFFGQSGAATLGHYGADPTKVSVSGVSSGAAMAVQLHVAFSSSIMGVGAVAGVPYYCAQGSALRATLYECSAAGDPSDVDIQFLKSKTETWASSGKVDSTSNLASSRVYLFSGTNDFVVKQGLVHKLEDYYSEFISNTDNIKTVYNQPAGHAFITDDYGALCGFTVAPFINDCNYKMAYHILKHIYGNLEEPTSSTTASGQLLDFSQTTFFPFYYSIYRPMMYTGYIYVPTGCQSSTSNCKLHVALHGCSQTTDLILNQFYTKTGFNEVGELNNIIILYPQAKRNSFLGNTAGCWDWWGYSGNDYATKTGWEMKAIKGMIDRILE
ncbi:uncharacterized protein LOC110984319 isoform X2 [Acanthaster planci]|uniref:Uncharacterized protein LOC110984319 isoform X2 n=1 Tax=Acanthaster planci TaxID=133434 RepID=A0A8B7Z351_ACAPL|nr:uncharacterized protein LOC110984319 isoform X2 [Acanthaster planci]